MRIKNLLYILQNFGNSGNFGNFSNFGNSGNSGNFGNSDNFGNFGNFGNFDNSGKYTNFSSYFFRANAFATHTYRSKNSIRHFISSPLNATASKVIKLRHCLFYFCIWITKNITPALIDAFYR